MSLRNLYVAALALVLAAGCADMQNRPNQMAGTVIGAAAGGLAGAQFGQGKGQLAATALGALVGSMVGGNVGAKLDAVDRSRATDAHERALDTGQTIKWSNPDTGNHGSVVPVRTGTNTQTGSLCREFQTTIVVGGQEEQAYGTACQQADGSWKITN